MENKNQTSPITEQDMQDMARIIDALHDASVPATVPAALVYFAGENDRNLSALIIALAKAFASLDNFDELLEKFATLTRTFRANIEEYDD